MTHRRQPAVRKECNPSWTHAASESHVERPPRSASGTFVPGAGHPLDTFTTPAVNADRGTPDDRHAARHRHGAGNSCHHCALDPTHPPPRNHRRTRPRAHRWRCLRRRPGDGLALRRNDNRRLRNRRVYERRIDVFRALLCLVPITRQPCQVHLEELFRNYHGSVSAVPWTKGVWSTSTPGGGWDLGITKVSIEWTGVNSALSATFSCL